MPAVNWLLAGIFVFDLFALGVALLASSPDPHYYR